MSDWWDSEWWDDEWLMRQWMSEETRQLMSWDFWTVQDASAS